MKNYKILEKYNLAKKDLQKINDDICNLQRERDYKVTKIDQKYTTKIGEKLEIQSQLDKILMLTKKIIGTNNENNIKR